MQKPKAADMWNERFAIDEYFYGTEPNDFLSEYALRFAPGARVLMLGEGEGRNAVFLARRGCRVTALDASAVGLEKARRLAASADVSLETVVADLNDYRIQPGGWDAIVAIWCHLPPALRARVHAEAVRGLVPGGFFLLEAYTPKQLVHGTGGPKDVQLLMRLEDLRAELAGLSFEVAHETEREIHEGKGHQGRSAVVQVLGRRRA